MKTTTACIGALSLATLAMAQPSGHRRHQHLHEKRDVVATVVDVQVVTDVMPDVIVYVDESGNVLSSVTSGQAATPAPSTVETPVASAAESTSVYVTPTVAAAYVATTSSSVYVAPTSSSVYVASSSSSVYVSSSAAAATSSSVATSTTSSAASSSSTTTSDDGPSGYGLVYSPYMDDGTCKTAEQVSGDLASISGYSFIRSYGVDCDQVTTILAAVKAKDMKLMVGVYDITETSSAIQTIISAVGDDWDYIDTVAIGNEGVNNGEYTVDAVVSAIATARSLLKATSFSGSVVTVDTFVATIANPELCENSDYAAVNCHAFFDGTVAAADAGPWVLEQMERVSAACGGKNTWITETGWPTKGDTNGDAIPGASEQTAALASIKSAISANVILFSAFNDYWKTDSSSTYGAEKYWGMYGSSKYSTDSE